MPNDIPLPGSTLPGRTVTLYDKAGNAVEVSVGDDGLYRLAVAAPGVEDKLDRIIQLLEDADARDELRER